MRIKEYNVPLLLLLIVHFFAFVLETDAVEVSILTQNVWFILIAYIPANDRAPLIIENLRNSTYDVLCLQEVWSSKVDMTYVDMLREGLKDIYPYSIETQPEPISPFSVLDSGLLLFSKYPIASFAFHTFGNSSGIDALSDKGVMIAHIEIPDEETGFIIANTHFQAGGQDEIRYNQSLELVAALDNFVSSLGGSLSTSQLPIFAAGDFNTKELGDDGITRAIDYLQLVDTLEAKDLFREVNGGNATAFTTFGGRRLDYVFGLSVDYELIDAGIDDFVNKSEIRLSDHLGSYAVVDIPPGLNNKGTDFGRNSGGIDWKLSLSLFLSTMTLMHLGEVL